MNQDIFLAFAHRLADQASKAILPHFRSQGAVSDKETMLVFDPVTEGDRAGEMVMRDLIMRSFPDHGIEGEEFGLHNPGASHVWVLDPIDGTRAFVAGLPLWTILVALRIDGEPVVGLIDQPIVGDRFTGNPAGAWRNDHPIRVRGCDDLSTAYLSTTGTSWFTQDQKTRFGQLEQSVKMCRYGYDAYAYGVLAMGYLDCVAEAGLKSHDLAALIPVVRGAGGTFCDWRGGQDYAVGEVLACGDARLQDQALKRLGG